MRSNTPYAIQLRAHARSMRRQPTPGEFTLWGYLRARKVLGVQFRRQQIVLGRRIVDFLAPKLSLVVEVQGGYHALTASADARRAAELRRAGYHVVFVSEQLVLQQPAEAVKIVRAAVAELLLG